MDIERLIELHPRIYHMAEKESWPSIRQHGLLSSNEVARLSGLSGHDLRELRSGHRAEKVTVDVPGIGAIVLRDQKPMSPDRIRRALIDGTPASRWYELINDRVFFWVREERLLRLLGAREYRTLEHDVLTLDTASLLADHAQNVRLCHMNSGNTFPIPHFRDMRAFTMIAAYPTTSTGRPLKPIVELTVLGSVPDIRSHVVEVRRMRGTTVIGQLPR